MGVSNDPKHTETQTGQPGRSGAPGVPQPKPRHRPALVPAYPRPAKQGRRSALRAMAARTQAANVSVALTVHQFTRRLHSHEESRSHGWVKQRLHTSAFLVPLPAAGSPRPSGQPDGRPLTLSEPRPGVPSPGSARRALIHAPPLHHCPSRPLMMQSMPMKPEAPLLETRSSLIQRLKATINGESWEEFFHTYWELIYNVARRAGLSEADAQDIVQETILKVHNSLDRFEYNRKRGTFKGGYAQSLVPGLTIFSKTTTPPRSSISRLRKLRMNCKIWKTRKARKSRRSGMKNGTAISSKPP